MSNAECALSLLVFALVVAPNVMDTCGVKYVFDPFKAFVYIVTIVKLKKILQKLLVFPHVRKFFAIHLL